MAVTKAWIGLELDQRWTGTFMYFLWFLHSFSNFYHYHIYKSVISGYDTPLPYRNHLIIQSSGVSVVSCPITNFFFHLTHSQWFHLYSLYVPVRGGSRLLKRGGTTRPVIIADVRLVRYLHS